MKKLTHFSLFSGIGGIDLAAESAGFETAGQVEFADYPTKILEKNFPNVPRWRDVRDVTAESFRERTGLHTVDLLSGGFPCQPFSVAGKQKGKKDDRYLWPEMLRIIRELKPRWVLGENVPGILRIAGRTVCEDLEREGYAVAVFDFEAAAVGASHRRERVFFVANAESGRKSQFTECDNWEEQWRNSQIGHGVGTSCGGITGHSSERIGISGGIAGKIPKDVADARQQPEGNTCDGFSCRQQDGCSEELQPKAWDGLANRSEAFPDTNDTGNRASERRIDRDRQEINEIRQEQSQLEFSGYGAVVENTRYSGFIKPYNACQLSGRTNVEWSGEAFPDTEGWGGLQGIQQGQTLGFGSNNSEGGFIDNRQTTEPGMGGDVDGLPARMDLSGLVALAGQEQHPWEPPRVATGIKNRTDRLKCLGNAVVPGQVYPILRAIAIVERSNENDDQK